MATSLKNWKTVNMGFGICVYCVVVRIDVLEERLNVNVEGGKKMAGLIKGIKSVLIPDVHINDKGYAKVYEPVKKFIADFKPDKIYLMGDFADCCSLSHWNLQKRRKMEGLRHKKEVANVEKEIKYLAKYCDEIVWLEGNHEDWLNQYLDKNPEMEGLIEYSELIDFEKYNIKWVPLNTLHKVGHLFLTHGMYINDHHAKKHLQKLGCNICYCHTHIPQTYGMNMKMQEPFKATCLGCLCDFKAPYLKGKEGNWINGFAVLYVAKNGEFNLYPVDVINKRFYWNDKRYD